MKKSVFGVAALIVVAPLFAQTSVHTAIKDTDLMIYGVADVFYAGYSSSNETKATLGSGGSRLTTRISCIEEGYG